MWSGLDRVWRLDSLRFSESLRFSAFIERRQQPDRFLGVASHRQQLDRRCLDRVASAAEGDAKQQDQHEHRQHRDQQCAGLHDRGGDDRIAMPPIGDRPQLLVDRIAAFVE